jgi:hypothetical protein
MEQAEYEQLTQQAMDLFESGRIEDVQEAIIIFEGLLDSDIPDLHKSATCHNLAVCADAQGRVSEALHWLDEGVRYEQGQESLVNAEAKALCLMRHGFMEKGLRAYEELLAFPWLTGQERQRIRDNLEVLRQLD